MGERDETRDRGTKAKDVTAAPRLDETAEAPRSEAADAAPPVPESLDQSIWPVIESSRYRIAGEHARGGLGRILEAIDCRLDRRVAVKQLLSLLDKDPTAAIA